MPNQTPNFNLEDNSDSLGQTAKAANIGGRPGASGSGQSDSINQYLPNRPGGGRNDRNDVPSTKQGC